MNTNRNNETNTKSAANCLACTDGALEQSSCPNAPDGHHLIDTHTVRCEFGIIDGEKLVVSATCALCGVSGDVDVPLKDVVWEGSCD